MSRIGKLPIPLPVGVNCEINGDKILISGPLGNLEQNIPSGVLIEIKDGKLFIRVLNESKKSRALHGLFRTLLGNMVLGVSKNFEVNLRLKGVGYRCQVEENRMTLNLGYSHPIKLIIPDSLGVKVDANTDIKIYGIDKERVGFFASKIRSFRPPEPYNGKGVLYKDEVPLRKAGKSGKK